MSIRLTIDTNLNKVNFDDKKKKKNHSYDLCIQYDMLNLSIGHLCLIKALMQNLSKNHTILISCM